MSKYIGKKEKLSEWIKTALIGIGDGEVRVLSQFFAKAGIEGFSKKNVLEMLENYKELKQIDFSLKDNFITSFMRVEKIKEIQKEAEAVLNNEKLPEETEEIK